MSCPLSSPRASIIQRSSAALVRTCEPMSNPRRRKEAKESLESPSRATSSMRTADAALGAEAPDAACCGGFTSSFHAWTPGTSSQSLNTSGQKRITSAKHWWPISSTELKNSSVCLPRKN